MELIRKNLIKQRKSIKNIENDRLSRKLLSNVQKIARFKNQKKIAVYLASNGEINPKYIKKFLESNGFSVYLPVLLGKTLKFAKDSKKTKKNKFGIDEPCASQILRAKSLNIIFIPLVGFDEHKNRIGMGGGFYDRALSFKQRQKKYHNPKIYGLAFDLQKVPKIKSRPWDIKLDAIITPTKIYQ